MSHSLISSKMFLKRAGHLLLPKRNGYIVLVPEIGEDMPEKNNLFRTDGLPEFNLITIENCVAAIGKQALEYEAGIVNLENSLKKLSSGNMYNMFDHVFNSLEYLGAPLNTTWGLAKTLYVGNRTLMPTKSYLTIHERAKRARVSKFNSSLIYSFCKTELKKADDKTVEQKRLLKKFLLEGKLNGLDLTNKQKEHLEEVMKRLSFESSQYRGKCEVATKQFSHMIADSTVMRDFPETILKSLAVDETKPLQGPWKVTLQPQICGPFLEHCPDRDLRWNVWQAQVQRACGYSDKSLNNSVHIEEIRSLRKDQANILGYKNFVDMSLETKMVEDVPQIEEMFSLLLEKTKPAQEKELTNLEKFATDRGFEGNLQLWDYAYWKRKQKKSLYNYNEELIKQYFSLPIVIAGLFKFCEQLFNIFIIEDKTNTWHEDVKYYNVFDPESIDPIAGFYLDPYSRKNEKIRSQETNGWMVGIKNRSDITEMKPLAALIFNFEPPVGKTPSLLTIDELQCLFYKFGHALQHLLSECTYSEVAGLSNVEWDAVEICGRTMAHWALNPNILYSIGKHYQTNETIPDDMIDNLQDLRSHMAGTKLCHDIYLAKLDLELYSTKEFWLEIVRRLWKEHMLLPLDKQESHLCSFPDIFSEQWGAAYYSHIWSEIIAADIYTAFIEAEFDSPKMYRIGKRFRSTYLSLGGGCHPTEVFRRFRGRDPSPLALLQRVGLY